MTCTAPHNPDARAVFATDPGHGWLEVREADFPCARTYGTGFGYVDSLKGTVLLEEDVEAARFLEDHPWMNDRSRIAQQYREHGIRSLPRLPEWTDPGALNDPPTPPEALNVERDVEALDFLQED